MKRVICDTCGAQTEPNEYGLPPAGSPWVAVTTRSDYKSLDFCSPACAIAALTPLTPVNAAPVTSAETQEFIDTGRFPPAPIVDLEVARMRRLVAGEQDVHDNGNPNGHESVF